MDSYDNDWLFLDDDLFVVVKEPQKEDPEETGPRLRCAEPQLLHQRLRLRCRLR